MVERPSISRLGSIIRRCPRPMVRRCAGAGSIACAAPTWARTKSAALPVMLVALVLRVSTTRPGLAWVDQEALHMPTSENMSLPAPSRDGSMSLERALQNRRMLREFTPDRERNLTIVVGNAGHHRVQRRSHRPVGGGAVSTGDLSGRGPRPGNCSRRLSGDMREALAVAARTTGEYVARASCISKWDTWRKRTVQAAALELNASVVGAFDDDRVARELYPRRRSPLMFASYRRPLTRSA